MKRWTSSIWLFMACAALPLVAIAALNAIVDPYDITRWVTIDGVNQQLNVLSYQSRLTKALGIVRDKPDTIILGSSVVDFGFALPGSTRYDSLRRREMRPQLAAPGVFNSGISAGGVEEALSYLKHAYLNNPQLKRVIVGLEWRLFTDLKGPPWPVSAFLNHSFVWPPGVFKYLTWTAADDAVRTVQSNRALPVDGLWGLIARIATFVRSAAATPVEGTPDASEAPLVRARSLQETRSFFYSLREAAELRSQLSLRGIDATARSDRVRMFRELVSFAHEKGIELIVYIPPQHAVYWAAMRNEGLWERHIEWLREIGHITPFYEFSELIDFSSAADDSFPGDPLHFTSAAGERLLNILVRNERKPSPGVDYVTPGTLEAALKRRTARLTDWISRNDYFAAAFAEAVRKPMIASTPLVAPTPFAPAPAGFKIVRMFNGKFYALPARDAPYDLNRVMRHRYDPLVEGDSADEVVAVVAQKHLKVGDYVTIDPTAGAAIGSGPDGTPAHYAFDGSSATFWASPERGSQIKEHSWIGYVFAAPQPVREIRIEQPLNPPYRQDRVRVQASRDGGATWTDVLPDPAEIRGAAVGVVFIPREVPPASAWRILAAGDNATDENHIWFVNELSFFGNDQELRRSPLVPASLQAGGAIASGENNGPPPRNVFDGKRDTFWVSPQHGANVKDQAWIGYAFANPQAIRRLIVQQAWNPGYQQDRLRIDASADGQTWRTVSGAVPVQLPIGIIDLPGEVSERYWRVVAAGDNATAPEHSWIPIEVELFVAAGNGDASDQGGQRQRSTSAPPGP